MEYLDGLRNYISNRVIAWNYNNKHIRFPNGTFFIRDFDYNVGYTIKTNKTTNSSFVYVFMVNLKPEEFGLKASPMLKEIKDSGKMVCYLKESQLIQMITESVIKILHT